MERLLVGARTGPMQVAIVEGEAGIGKTRLVREVGEQAGREGWSLITGGALESDANTPYALAVDLARAASPVHKAVEAMDAVDARGGGLQGQLC